VVGLGASIGIPKIDGRKTGRKREEVGRAFSQTEPHDARVLRPQILPVNRMRHA
jgi:hypothetical protein